MDLGNRPTLEPNFSSIYESHLKQTFLYHILVATYIKQRLSFLLSPKKRDILAILQQEYITN